MESNLPIPNRALAVGAHPDDVEFGCGGTLAKWAANGCEIFHLVCTDGSKGTWDPAHDPAELVVTRRNEQRAASVALGGKGEVVFLGWPDGELEAGLRQRFEVVSAGSGPMSSSVMTRGSATACIQTTAMRAFS